MSLNMFLLDKEALYKLENFNKFCQNKHNFAQNLRRWNEQNFKKVQ